MSPTDHEALSRVVHLLKEKTDAGTLVWTPIQNGEGGFRTDFNGYSFIINGLDGTFRAWGHLRAVAAEGGEDWVFDRELARGDLNRFAESALVSEISRLWREIRDAASEEVNQSVRHSLRALSAA